MKKYRLDIIMESALFFEQNRGESKDLVDDLRIIQSKKDGLDPDQIKEIDDESLAEALSSKTMCVEEVKSSIIQKHEEILNSDWTKISAIISPVFLEIFLIR